MQHPRLTFFKASAHGRAGQLGAVQEQRPRPRLGTVGIQGRLYLVGKSERVPWLRRGGHRLGLDWGDWKLLPHSLKHLPEYLGSFDIQVFSSTLNNVDVIHSANVYGAPCATHCTRLEWGCTNVRALIARTLEAQKKGICPGGGKAFRRR